MKGIIKKQIKHFLNQFGYDIVKKFNPNINLYSSFSTESLKERRFYNMGAGLFYHPYWTNIDYATDYYSVSQKKSFINYNLMELKPLPFKNNIAEIIYSSHTIEHISDDAVINMLKESYRVLKPGGGIRLTTPDILLKFKAYKRNDITFWCWIINNYSKKGTWEKLYKSPLSKASIHQLFLHNFASQLCEIDIDDSPLKKYSDAEIIDIFKKHSMEEALNYFTKQCKFNTDHPGSHINWWTHEKLLSLLQKVGFSEYYISGYGQSLFLPLRDTSLFDSTHPKISLYVEAIK